MDLQTTETLLELVRESYHRVMSAQNFYNAYRRTAVENGIPTPVRPEFPALARELVETAKELDRRKEAIRNAIYGVGIIQAEIYSADGQRKRSVVVMRPTDKVREPHITWAAYHALSTMLGEPLTASTPFDIAVVDDFGRVSDHRIKAQGEKA